MHSSRNFRPGLVALSVLLAPLALSAQADRGSIRGQVLDEQRSNVPNATLTLLNEETGVTARSTSSSTGAFNFNNLNPGLYTLTTAEAGFGTRVQEHIVVAVGTTTPLDLVLKLASVQETVVVTSGGVGVETQTSEIGTVVTPREIADLPVPMSSDSRNPLSFVALTPGVAGSTPGAQPDYRLHISGSPSDSNEVYIDGVPIISTNLQGDVSLDHPPIDAVGEFKVVNNNQSAQYGLASSAISFTFKSGANAFHGSAFEFLQNDKLDANDYISNALGQKRAPLKQNEYGGTFSGPVRIPHLYNGRDKTFFFFEYSQFAWRPSSNNASLTTLPNQYRMGNFQQALGAQLVDPVSGLPVYDLLGQPVFSGEIYDPKSGTPVAVNGVTYTVRTPFAGNMVPQGSIDPVAANILPFFPTATNNGINNNFFRQQATKNDEHRLVAKIDHTFNEKNNISGSFFQGSYNNGNNGTLSALDGSVVSNPTNQVRFTYNYTPNPRLSNNLNLGFLRDITVSGPPALGPGLSALGINGLPAAPGAAPFPIINLQGSLSTVIGSAGSLTAASNRYFASDNVTLTRGSHTISFGGELRRLQRNEIGVGTPQINFAQTETGQNGIGHAGSPTGPIVSIPTGTGNSGASFLTGAVDFSNASFPISQGYRWLQTGMYAQDDWKVTKNLVLNLGVRYDILVPRTEVNGYASTVNVNLPNPGAGGLPGAYTFYGTGPGRNGQKRIGNIDYKAFQPRIGFAFTPFADQKTSFRGGYSITRPAGNDNLENGIGSSEYSIGFSGAAIASKPGDTVGSPAFFLSQGFPKAGVTPAVLSPSILVGLTNPAIIYPSAGSPPTQMNWAFQVQQEMPGKIIATIGYVGSHSYHIGVWSKPNEVNPQVAAKYAGAAAAAHLGLNDFLQLPVTSAVAGNSGFGPNSPFANFGAIFGPGATIAQALRPFPQYGSVDNPINPIGSVSYNGLQTSLQRRFSNGLTFLAAYTWSKTLGNVDSNNGASSGAENAQFSASFYQDYYNPRGARSVTSSDVPQVIALSYTYELPVGKGKAYLNRGGVVNQLAGGWEVSGIQQYQSGRPIHIEYDAFGDKNPYLATDGFSFRPNIVPGQPLINPAYRKSCSGPAPSTPGVPSCAIYINPNAFVAPPAGQFGNAPTFISGLRLPFYLNESLSASKRFQIYERANLMFQANFFNAFNRVVFSNGGNPNTFIFNNAPANLNPGTLATTSSVFGQFTAQQNAPRMIQFALKLEF